MLKKLLIKWNSSDGTIESGEFWLGAELGNLAGVIGEIVENFNPYEMIYKYYKKYRFNLLYWWITKGFKVNNMYWYKIINK